VAITINPIPVNKGGSALALIPIIIIIMATESKERFS
jgi:hypothetical protein